MKKQTIIGCVIIIIGLYIVLTNINMFNFGDRAKNDEQAIQTFNARGLEDLVIQSGSTNVKLLPSEDNQVRIKLYDSSNNLLKIDKYVTSKLDKNELTIKVRSKSSSLLIFSFSNRTLELELPSDLLHELSVDSSSGNIDVSDITTTNSITLEASSGNIKVDNSSSPYFSLETTSGNITVDQLIAKETELEASSGNIKLTDFTTEKLDLASTSGNITVNGDSASIEAEATSGNITLDLEQLTADSYLESTSGNIKLNLKKADSLHVIHEKTSGSSSITKTGFETRQLDGDTIEGIIGKGEVRLEVKTTSGNFQLR